MPTLPVGGGQEEARSDQPGKGIARARRASGQPVGSAEGYPERAIEYSHKCAVSGLFSLGEWRGL
jgi:hypothetical protein